MTPKSYFSAVKIFPLGSPFNVPCTAAVDATKVKAFGPGIEPNQCRAGQKLPFTVDASKSGKAPLDVQVSSEKGRELYKKLRSFCLLIVLNQAEIKTKFPTP